MDRSDVSFVSGEDRCAAWLYTPSNFTGPGPIVVMGHGLGANRQMGLDKYAREFAAAGLLVLVFDYRSFGASEGEPRQLLDIRRERDDYHAAVKYVRGLPSVDASRVAVWGSSFGGGNVLAVGSEDPTIAAVVSQCPFTDGIASAIAMRPISLAKVAILATLDIAGSLLGRPPVMVSLSGRYGDGALMTAPDAVPGFGRLADESPLYRPQVAARVGASILLDAPGRKTKNLAMPVFYAICDKDIVAPTGPTIKAAARTPNAVVKHYPVGHFDIYYDEPFERAVKDQTEFLVSVLQP
ncbi:alpha/beta hydrolase [Antrihabitans stalactiti]|uniref:Alpha/beta fold hydrolase n=1 Tax=Antrihabitans stalactiti TaxID=2584121 RepID=A0A848KDJ9_9NOCA|nr:alpha/beta hydrolase [Antrihabitans stalactiti]NMN94782.1 alpha/beta fold hydrolase [Antrihabitans stalactiti]